jgi:hypothetical protein
MKCTKDALVSYSHFISKCKTDVKPIKVKTSQDISKVAHEIYQGSQFLQLPQTFQTTFILHRQALHTT